MNNGAKVRVMSILLKLICIAAVIYGCTTISEGWSTVTKFTTLSNIGIGIATLIVFIAEIAERNGHSPKHIQGMYLFKYMMTVSIMITFILFLAILAPTSDKGFIGAYMNNRCGSLAHHFIAPLVAILDFFIYDRDYLPKAFHALLGLITPAVYVVYIVILALAGYRWPSGMLAPYNFLNFGAPTGWWGFDPSQMSSTSLGIGVGYLIAVLLIVFALFGYCVIILKKAVLRQFINKTQIEK